MSKLQLNWPFLSLLFCFEMCLDVTQWILWTRQIAGLGTRTALSYKGCGEYWWDKTRSSQRMNGFLSRWATVRPRPDKGWSVGRETGLQEKDGGQRQAGYPVRACSASMAKLELSAHKDPGPILSVRIRPQFREEQNRQKGGFQFRGSWPTTWKTF